MLYVRTALEARIHWLVVTVVMIVLVIDAGVGVELSRLVELALFGSCLRDEGRV